MKPEELRVGNWVYEDETVYTYGITKIAMKIKWKDIANFYDEAWIKYFNSNDDAGDYWRDVIQPIPLTEEWLLKFGFEESDVYPISMVKGSFRVNYGNQATWTWNNYPVNDIKYVHQLQNLYYALQGEELKIKE